MKYKIGSVMIFVGLCAGAVPAWAEEPYYFHKAGVSREHYMDDVNDCAELGGGVRVAHYQVYAYGSSASNNAIAAGIGSFFAALTGGRERRRLISRVERTCMADKGYQRRAIDKASYGEIKKLSAEAKIDRMFGLVSAEQPQGKALVE